MSDPRGYEEGVRAAFDLVMYAACNTDDEALASRLSELAEDIIEEAPTYKAKWKDITALIAQNKEQARTIMSLVTEPPLNDHQFRELVNDLWDTSLQYRDAQQLRERIATALRKALPRIKEIE